MGMAMIASQQTPKSLGENVTVCRNPACNAQYNTRTAYERGYHGNHDDDTGELNFIAVRMVPDGCCPVCGTHNAAVSGCRSDEG